MDNNSVTYGSVDGPAYLNIKSNSQAQKIFNNFVTVVLGRNWRDNDTDVSTEYQKIKLALEEYNAVYRFDQAKNAHYVKKHFIRFATPADATAFVLRFA